MSSITRRPVDSSNIKSVGYDPSTLTLEIEFTSGIYQFAGVSQKTFNTFETAGSKGRFFATFIKGRYESTKIETSEEVEA